MTEPIRVLIVDDHPLLREGITMVLAQEKDMLLVGAASTGHEAVSLYTTTRPDLVLMDLRLPDMSGIDAMTAIRASSPRAKVVILTTFEGDAEVSRALNAGAAGYLLKSMPRKQIVEALRQVLAGRRRVAPAVAATLAEHLGQEALSQREISILQRVAEGDRNKEIAARLSRTRAERAEPVAALAGGSVS